MTRRTRPGEAGSRRTRSEISLSPGQLVPSQIRRRLIALGGRLEGVPLDSLPNATQQLLDNLVVVLQGIFDGISRQVGVLTEQQGSAVDGPAWSNDDHVATFDGDTGTLLQHTDLNVSTDPTKGTGTVIAKAEKSVAPGSGGSGGIGGGGSRVGYALELKGENGIAAGTTSNVGGKLSLFGGDATAGSGMANAAAGGNVEVSGGASVVGATGGDVLLYGGVGNAGGADGDVLLAFTGSAARGKVAVGKATATEIFDVSGNIAVSGTVDGVDIAALDSAAVKDGEAAGGELGGTYPNPTIPRLYLSPADFEVVTGGTKVYPGSRGMAWQLADGVFRTAAAYYPKPTSWSAGKLGVTFLLSADGTAGGNFQTRVLVFAFNPASDIMTTGTTVRDSSQVVAANATAHQPTKTAVASGGTSLTSSHEWLGVRFDFDRTHANDTATDNLLFYGCFLEYTPD